MGIWRPTQVAEPATPATGFSRVYVDSTTKALTTKDDSGVVKDYSSIDMLTPTTTKGDLLVEGASALTRLAVGADDFVLTADSAEATGVKWAAAAGGSSPTWTSWATVTINNGGTLTYTTANARYYIDGKILYAQYDFTQTAAGSGTTDITIDPPGGVTLLDAATCGTVGGFDIGNDNVYSTHAVEAVNSTNVFKIRRTGASSYFRGGTHVGNNGNGYGFSVVAGIA